MLRIKIKNPDMNLLKTAMEAIAKKLNGNLVENFVVTGWGLKRKCLFAIPMELPYGNGYGVFIDKNGELKICVDDHGAPLSAVQFAELLEQTYVALAVATAAQQLGYNVANIQELKEGILLDLEVR